MPVIATREEDPTVPLLISLIPDGGVGAIATETNARVGRLYVSADISGTQGTSKLRRKTNGIAE